MNRGWGDSCNKCISLIPHQFTNNFYDIQSKPIDSNNQSIPSSSHQRIDKNKNDNKY